eukprot:TRINITY_DN30036_c0_g2_i1.p1 TRINITY_DN30036_c0_g2~~TRINITY_DN30036_c0_g2_i1.p1  ORF type:complete len:1328 (+),score=272.84 TRINITY_DN30036_c0_g2_i1:291-3986(+)
MEFCGGGDLKAEVTRRAKLTPPERFPESQIMTWFVQLTLALNHMHQQHILHRDLKSSNIFLTTEAEGRQDVKIGDFGISRVLEGTVEVAATVVGTPYYMSPEVCRAEPYGVKSDIWALGCVLYEMCMLKHAFESQSLLGLVYKIVSETYEPIPSEYSAELSALMDRVLDKSHFTRPCGKDLIVDPLVKRFLPGATAAAASTAGASSSVPVAALAGPSAAPQHRSPQPAAQQPSPQPPKPPQRPWRFVGGGPRPAAPARHSFQPPQKPKVAPETPPRLPASSQAATPASPKSGGGNNGAWAAPPSSGGLGADSSPMRRLEPDLAVEEEPVCRIWCATPAAAAQRVDERELRVQVLLRRIQTQLGRGRQNWLQVFASFDHVGNGLLQDAQFEQALTSMALGLSDNEIREVRTYLQGAGIAVSVERFGTALNQSRQAVLQLEAWGRSVLLDLAREAARRSRPGTGGIGPTADGNAPAPPPPGAIGRSPLPPQTDGAGATAVAEPGAHVRVRGVQSAVGGGALNGAEGTIERWDATSCHWVVRLSDGTTKGVRDHHLVVTQPAAAGTVAYPNAVPATTAIYRLLCSGGDTAVPEYRFLDVVRELLPSLSEAERCRLLLLVPKCPEGRVDVPEVLSRIAAGPARPPVPGADPRGYPSAGGLGHFSSRGVQRSADGRQTSKRHVNFAVPLPVAVAVPGAVPSPRPATSPPPAMSRRPPPASPAPSGVPTAGGSSNEQAAQAALLRLAQRLIGNNASCEGPGLDTLRLFAQASRPTHLRQEELLDMVSVLPLGISRAEVRLIFAHVAAVVGASDSDSLPFSLLTRAAESAHQAGLPSEAAAMLERLDTRRLGAALRRLASADNSGGRTAPQEFRVTLMQAEPYLTPSQLEWLTMLVDKDGEGRLLPHSLLVRLGVSTAAPPVNSATACLLMVPPRPAGSTRGPVAPGAPRSLVVDAVLARLRARLAAAGPQLTLERLLGLLDLERSAQPPRDALASLFGHLRLGISAAEADELTGAACAGESGGDGGVPLAALLELHRRAATDSEAEARVAQLREAATSRLRGRGATLACALSAAEGGGEWLPESEFRRCLLQTLSDGDRGLASAPASDAEAVERFLLLAEKNAAGAVRWLPFVQTYGGLGASDDWERTVAAAAASAGVTTTAGFGAARSARADPTQSQQSWRSLKLREAALRDAGDAGGGSAWPPARPSPEKLRACCEASPKSSPPGLLRCLRRWLF